MYIKKLPYNNKLFSELFDIKYHLDEESEKSEYVLNENLNNYMLHVKNNIEKDVESWNKYKKYTNPYELIGSSFDSISLIKIRPISRAYYKFTEIYNSFNLDTYFPPSTSLNSFHLAEGPGGFIEALTYIRKKQINPTKYEFNDKYIGISLRPDETDKNKIKAPSWFKGNTFLSNNPHIEIEYGETNDGDINNPINFEYHIRKYGNSMDLITGDGGFDFSSDYTKQELVVFPLLFSQVLYAITMQKKKGVFIMKVFDLYHKYSIDLIYFLSYFYHNVYIVKPHTSRVATSEKYIVCVDYKFSTIRKLLPQLLDAFVNIHTNCKTHNLKSLLKTKIPINVMNTIEEVNCILGQKQIENINFTLQLINNHNNVNINDLVLKHKQLCVDFCKKNNIPLYDKFGSYSHTNTNTIIKSSRWKR